MKDDKFLGDFAEEFSRQLRSGHAPSEEELKEVFPELTDDLMGFASTLSMLEEAGFQHRIRGAAPTVADASGQRWTHVGGFRLIREIGRGGMGIVYEAEQEALQRRVAIKVLPSNPMLTKIHLTRFKREGMAIARLHHSHIVPVFGTGEQNGIHYCVMQIIEGCSLDQLIFSLRQEYAVVDSTEDAITDDFAADPYSGDVDAPNDDSWGCDHEFKNHSVDTLASLESLKCLLLGRTPSAAASSRTTPVRAGDSKKHRRAALPAVYWKNVARIGADMADALSHAHSQGVLHRDVKPGNLLVDKHGHAWLTDFGVAKLADHGNVTMTGGLIGTLRYAPPEQFEGKSDERSDVYSLGLTLYELCALQPAFSANERRELMRQISESVPPKLSRRMPGIPVDLETIINKAMATAPADRYQKSADLAKDLRSFISDQTVTARKLSTVARSWRWCRRHRTESALGVTIAMMLIAFGITATAAYLRESRLRRQLERTASTAISAINRVYDSYVPDWTTSSTVSAHGSISVSPATAQLLSGLLRFYDELAARSSRTLDDKDLLEITAALRRVALIYHRLGMFGESKDAYGKAIVRINSLSQRNPSGRIQLEHARVSNEIGALYWTERQIAEAFEAHQIAYGLLQKIPEQSGPSIQREILFEKARTIYLMGRRARGRHGGVPLRPVITRRQENFDKKSRRPQVRAEQIGKATEILLKLVEDAPYESAYRHLLALCYIELSEGTFLQVDQVDHPIAKAIDILEKLVKEDPLQPAYRYSLCICLLSSDLGKEASELAMSITTERIDRSISIARELAQQHPEEWIYVATQVEANLLKTTVQSRRGLLNEAHECATQAVVDGMRLVEKYPNVLSFQYWVAVAHQLNGSCLVDSGRNESGLTSLDDAFNAFRHVYQSNRDWEHVVLNDLKQTSSLRAQALELIGNPEAAELAQRDAKDYAVQLAEALADGN